MDNGVKMVRKYPQLERKNIWWEPLGKESEFYGNMYVLRSSQNKGEVYIKGTLFSPVFKDKAGGAWFDVEKKGGRWRLVDSGSPKSFTAYKTRKNEISELKGMLEKMTESAFDCGKGW